MNALDLAGIFVLTNEDLPPDHAAAVLDAAAASRPEIACIQLEGAGAVNSIQALTTNDIVGPGDDSFLYSAFLTRKGMVISDSWISRSENSVSLFVPTEARDEILDLLHRSIPPRLARVVDESDDSTVFRLLGPLSLERASLAGFSVPDPGQSIRCSIGPAEYLLSRPTDPAPFALQILAHTIDTHDVDLTLEESDFLLAHPASLEIARVIAGFPRLGSEIGNKTLPQEIRFDDINGLSYTKGCYTGQEVVARLHFRGHANKGMVGISWEGDPDRKDQVITQSNASIGRVTSMIWLDPIDQYIGLGIVKSAADFDQPVVAAGCKAAIVELPFRFDS